LPKPKPAPRAETYSVVVNNVRVQELLFALARDAKLNVDIHPGISGAVTLNAIDQTLPQILTRIAKQVDMRYELDGPNLVVMPDSPYLRIYKIDYVNMERNMTGTVSVSGQITGAVAGLAAGAAPGAGANASSVTVRDISNNRFWDSLVDNISDILRETDKILPATPLATLAAQAQAQAQAGAGAGVAGAAPPFQPAVPNVAYREAASVIANREAGVITIRATSRQHEKIQEFLDQVMASARRQVLIEATIVEVRLSTNYEQGIDWRIFSDGLRTIAGAAVPSPWNVAQIGAKVPDAVFTLGYTSSRFSAAIRLLETFGNVRVLSSPRISAINNQTAVLRVVDNVVYFNVTAQQSQAANVGTLATSTTTPQSVAVGIVMYITPNVSDNDLVLFNLRPSISRVIRFVRDPNPTLAAANIENLVPEIQTREMESVIKVANGDIAVMGGLIQDRVDATDSMVPGANRLPIIGNIFGNRNLQSEKIELVIFLRPVVIKDASIDGDYRGYRELLPGEDFMRENNPARVSPRGEVLRP
jgi:general secretion pathway protein D